MTGPHPALPTDDKTKKKMPMAYDVTRITSYRGGTLEFGDSPPQGVRASAGMALEEVELDVHPTADGVIMVHHDATLDRTADATGAIRDLTEAQVRAATIVFVTHDQTEALSHADRIAVMKDGHLQQVDTPDAVYDRPANRFAGGLGAPTMNFLPAEALEGWTGPREVDLGLRPEALRVHRARPALPAIGARLALTEMTGAEAVLQCESPLGRLTAVAPRGEGLPSPGEVIWLEYDAVAAHRFDHDTGCRA